MEEKWRKIIIDNQETFYSVSDLGRVRNDKTGTLLAGTINNNGYHMVHLRQRVNKYCSIHRLVMKAFCPCVNQDDLEINHKDGNRTNNALNNLEWVNHIDNMRSYRSNSVGKCYQYDLDGKFLNEYENFSEAARILNIDDYSIWRCLREEYSHAGKYQFKNYKKEKIDSWFKPNTKKVYVYNDDGEFIKTYNSQVEAARDFGLSPSSIARYVKSIRKLEGFVFSSTPL